MTDLSFSLPADLARQVETRIAEGEFADAGDYLRDLIQRDLDEAADTAWVKEMIAEGEASGYLDASPHAIIEEIIAERHARRA